jgi:hypothetical protein
MRNKKSEFKRQISKAKRICEEECGILYLEKDIDIAYDHYSPEVQTIFLKEDPETTVRVTHEAVKPISDKIKKINKRWQIGLLITRPELFQYDGEDDD